MDNRQLIMEKALELFCARGYDAVGVQEIAEQSGITKPTLYYYFGSKQGLMETILEENSRILEEMLEKAVEEPGDVPQVLYRVARAYFDFAGSHWQFYLFMLSQFYSGKKSEGFRTVYPLIQKYYQLVVRIFEDSADRLGNMGGRQEQFAVSFNVKRQLRLETCRGASEDTNVSCGSVVPVGRTEKPPFAVSRRLNGR